VFEAEWQELVGAPSSCSAPDADAAGEREALMEGTQAGAAGFVAGLTVTRRSMKGTLFDICDATLWNIETPTGEGV